MPENPQPPASSLPEVYPRIGVFAWLPSVCGVCGSWPSQGICKTCFDAFKVQPARCKCCGIDLPSAELKICGLCLKEPFAFDQTIAAVSYASVWKELVQSLKFYKSTDHAKLMAHLMHLVIAAHAKTAPAKEGDEPDMLLPIPSAFNRIQERGFNQAWEIARRFAKHTLLPAEVNILHRVDQPSSQTQKKRKDRFKALRHAFQVHEVHHKTIAGKNIVLVDDVMTTGATMHYAAQTLKEAGAKQVSAWVFARTPEQRTPN